MSKRAKYTKLEKEAWIAQLVEHWLGTMEFVGSNTGKGEFWLKGNEFEYYVDSHSETMKALWYMVDILAEDCIESHD